MNRSHFGRSRICWDFTNWGI